MRREGLRVCLADPHSVTRRQLVDSLGRLGHEIVDAVSDGTSLIESCRRRQPDLALTDSLMPDVNGTEVAVRIALKVPMPIIFMSPSSDLKRLRRVGHPHVLAHLVKPFNTAELAAAIAVATAAFSEWERMRDELQEAQQALADRKVIERAKGVLMEKHEMSEQKAFEWLRSSSRNNSQKMIVVARILLNAQGTRQSVAGHDARRDGNPTLSRGGR